LCIPAGTHLMVLGDGMKLAKISAAQGDSP